MNSNYCFLVVSKLVVEIQEKIFVSGVLWVKQGHRDYSKVLTSDL